jgi:hypothetical protein
MSRNKHNALHRYAAGINAASDTSGVPQLPFFHPTQQGWKILCEDFNDKLGYNADSATYEFTAIGSGTAAASTGGIKQANSTTTINEGSIVQAITATVIPAASTKKLYLEVSATITAATMSGTEFFAGFSADQGTTATEFVAADGLSLAADDAFLVGKLDTATSMSFYATQSDAQQVVSFGSNPTTATRHVWSVYYSGTTYYLYKDGVQMASEVKTVFNDDAAMGFVSYFKSATAEAQSSIVNYVLMAYEL